MTSPTVIFSHGAWISPQFFETIQSRLNKLGYPTECPAHPSVGAEPPSKVLADDVVSFRHVLTNRADEGKDLIVVAHSYGGVVVSNAVKGLDKASRAKDSKRGGIIQVVYMGSFALDQGQSLLGVLGGSYPPWWRVEVVIPLLYHPLFHFANGDCRAIISIPITLGMLASRIFLWKNKTSGVL